ncbi:MAG: hypothetical protein ACWGNB_04905 [Thiogranum sp.]
MAACRNPGCLGNYDFARIAFFARKRFVDGCGTVELMATAESEQEKEEIALVSLLDLKDDEIRDLQLCCKFGGRCKVLDCRDKLKKLIENELGYRTGAGSG